MGRHRRNRAGAQLVGMALLLGAALGGCAWDEGVVTAPTTSTTTTTTAPPAGGPPPPPTTAAPPAGPTTTTTTAAPAGARSYTVKPGDTLYNIAQAHGISLEALVAANSGADPGALTVGQVLVIPPAPG